MDELAFQQMLTEAIQIRCAFEKEVLSRCVSCAQTEWIQIAEREMVTCQDASSFSRCTQLHEYLHQAFSFALGIIRSDAPLPHAQGIRVQCGGLKGLQQVLYGSGEVENVDEMLKDALMKWRELAEIPYSEVVHAAGQFYKRRHS